jgi:hypothetical protein
MIPTLITWGFDRSTGNPYLSCWLDCSKPENAKAVKMLYVRAHFTGENVSLLKLEEGMTRGDVAEWMSAKHMREEVIEKLNLAKVRESDIVRKKHESGNSMDFIMFD